MVSIPVERWVGILYQCPAALKEKRRVTVMRDYLHDEEQLGYQVDAWLSALRARGLSERRIGELAGLLGEAMSEGGAKTKEQECVLRRFEGWHATK